MSSEGSLRPLIVGASGQVGTAFAQVFEEQEASQIYRSSRTPREGWLPLDLARLRAADDVAAALGEANPDLVLCTGAMTFVDGCEEDTQSAFLVNAHGPSALASWARAKGIPFVYFSSDYVYDGSSERPGPYNELAPAKPLSVYGASKLQGERAVLRVHPQALVIRTSWVYGADPASKNFLNGLLRQLRAGERVRVPSDQVSTPTYNRDLAEATLALVGAGASGIVHVTGPDLLSRFDLAKRIAAYFELDADLLQGVPTAELGQTAPRPLRSGLVSHRLPELLPTFRVRTLQQGLEDTRLSQAGQAA